MRTKGAAVAAPLAEFPLTSLWVLGGIAPKILVGDFLQRAAADTSATGMAIFVTWSHVDPKQALRIISDSKDGI
jgi:hypothetical protein